MSQNNFMFEWKKEKQYYDVLDDGSYQIHEDAPARVKQSYEEYERIMKEVNVFPKKRTSLLTMFKHEKGKAKQHTNVQHDVSSAKVRAIFDNESKQRIAKEILDALPDYFALDEAKQIYIEGCANLAFWAYYDEDRVKGFIAIKKHFKESGEVYVMGVLPQYHRQKIGRSLLKESIRWCRNEGMLYLQVKTLSADREDESYAKTRAFYQAMQFSPLEVFPTLWDISNPCLLMIKKL
ncbi:MAG: N-acetyltransferase [Erysipelotrichia bacterium]|nr:N-acetyltransferase [Erysipelotrichia bacterium]NCC55290.1 N-acetyltransferase [Erysipelotrichia bacterium]